MEHWETWAQMIRSDQMTAQEVIQFLDDHPEFADWYRETLL
jgi:hypothetical protein